MEQIVASPIAPKSVLKPYMEVPDYFGTQELFQLHKDINGLLIVSPQPTPNEIVKYYKSNSYISHGDSKGVLSIKNLSIYSAKKTSTTNDSN